MKVYCVLHGSHCMCLSSLLWWVSDLMLPWHLARLRAPSTPGSGSVSGSKKHDDCLKRLDCHSHTWWNHALVILFKLLHYDMNSKINLTVAFPSDNGGTNTNYELCMIINTAHNWIQDFLDLQNVLWEYLWSSVTMSCLMWLASRWGCFSLSQQYSHGHLL